MDQVNLEILHDEPITAADADVLGWTGHLDELLGILKEKDSVRVVGISGDWGSGKTSFLNLLHKRLKPDEGQEVAEPCPHREYFVPIFFEAWKYQHDDAPIVALLQEIRQQITWNKHFIDNLKEEVAKFSEVTIRSALLSLEDITKKVGIQASAIQKTGEQREQRRHEVPLPSDLIRKLLDEAIGVLINPSGKKREKKLLIIIDDLDRCHHQTAFQMLEGIKIYLNIKSCAFILGINQREIHRAIACNLEDRTLEEEELRTELQIRSREYLEKICGYTWGLPLVDEKTESKLLKAWVDKSIREPVCEFLTEFAPCLPANPRRIKAYCNTLNRIGLKALVDNDQWDSSPDKIAAVVITAYFRTYHDEICRILQREPGFYKTISEWVSTKDAGVSEEKVHPILDGLKLPFNPTVRHDSPTEPATGRATDGETLFQDPAYGNVLHIQKVIAKYPTLQEDFLVKLLRY